MEIDSLAQRVSSGDRRVVPTGGGTKPALTNCGIGVECLDMRDLAGITAYDPSEFLITAKAGTAVSEVVEVLGEHGQYLPYDPLYVEKGSTLGGSVASGVSGPNRLLYGGIRDFVMEVELIDGLGNRVRGGGKVVKNAAGFDLPKLMVGSYGRMGILTEVTMKVFPQPKAFATLSIHCNSIVNCISTAQQLQSQPLPITALDFTGSGEMYARFAGPAESLPSVLDRASALVAQKCSLANGDSDAEIWAQQRATIVAQPGKCLVRITISPNSILEFDKQITAREMGHSLSYSCGGTVAYLSADLSELVALGALLTELGLSAVVLAGSDEAAEALPTPFLGDQTWLGIANRIQQAMDPNGRFTAF